jgi:hypothetical protein
MGGTNERGLLIRGFGVSEILVSLVTIRTTGVFDHLVTFAATGNRSPRTAELGSIGGICIASPPEVSLGRLDDYPLLAKAGTGGPARPGRSVPLDADLEGLANA